MEARELLKKHGFTFKKAYGQNFLFDISLLKNIVKEADVEGKTVVEIGLGAGTLTRELSAVAKRVIGFEIDENLKPVLEETLFGANNVEIIYKDVMKVGIDVIEEMIKEEYVVVANLPYYITTPIVMRFIEEGKSVKGLVIMVQEEVADRFSAKAGTAEYGAATVGITAVADVKKIKRVPREAFVPSPNVDSAVVKIDIVGNRYGIEDFSTFRKVVKAAFTSRRKTLANNLIKSLSLSRIEAEELLIKAGIDVGVRGETLTAEQFSVLSNLTEKK